MDVTNTPRARVLARELRKAFDDSPLSLRDLAKLVGKSHTTLSMWMSAQRIPTTEDVATFLAHCGVNGAEVERILEIARRARDTNWLTAGMPGVSQQLAGAMECESTATKIVDWNPLIIPGLLQIGDYARSIITGNDVETRVRIRLGRRDVLTRRGAPKFLALIGEAAIRDVIGDPGIMAAQLNDLLRMAEHPNVDIRVVRGGQGWHPGLQGPFVIFQFSDTPPIVHFEHFRSGAFLYDEGDVQAYVAAVDMVKDKAMSPDASGGLIAEMIERLENDDDGTPSVAQEHT